MTKYKIIEIRGIVNSSGHDCTLVIANPVMRNGDSAFSYEYVCPTEYDDSKHFVFYDDKDEYMIEELLGIANNNDYWIPDLQEFEPCKSFLNGTSVTLYQHKSYFGNRFAVAEIQNTISMDYYICQVSFNEGRDFYDLGFDAEKWEIGDKIIKTDHGSLKIKNYIFVEEGPLVGIQFSVEGSLRLDDFEKFNGFDDCPHITTFALMRQPYNAWLWVYAFDVNGNQVVNFCGRDELDGLSDFVHKLKRKYNQ